MGGELELVSDGDGIAVIGASADIDRFFQDSGLDQFPSENLVLQKIAGNAGSIGSLAHVATGLLENSGRWVKLTAESAEKVRTHGLMPTKVPGVSHAMIGQPGEIQSWIQIATVPSKLLSAPLILSSISTVMQQHTLQQQIHELAKYLELINEKVDNILRSQKNAIFADLIGVHLILEEALMVRDAVGVVSDVTLSKIQATSQSIARTQAYALHELDDISKSLQAKAKLGELAQATAEAEPKVREWLALLARTLQLQDSVTVLELDRVLESSPCELETHRHGLILAKQNRLDLISRTTSKLLTQMSATIEAANSKVLFNPFESPAVVRTSNEVSAAIYALQERLGITSEHEAKDARPWGHAFGEVVTNVRTSVTGGVLTAKRLGEKALESTAGALRATDTNAEKPTPEESRLEQTGNAIRGAAASVTSNVGNIFRRKQTSAEEPRSEELPHNIEEST